MFMRPLIVAGIDTSVGKTLVSSILVELLAADYWKPIQTGSAWDSDSLRVKELTQSDSTKIHPEAYTFSAPCSPILASFIEGIEIDCAKICLPSTARPLIVEGCGGVACPISSKIMFLDMASEWNPIWIIVSRHYLGSLNHTFLTIELLKSRNQDIAGLIFNGHQESKNEQWLLQKVGLPLLGRIFPETHFSRSLVSWYANLWKTSLKEIVNAYGILLPRHC
jgi:dethiobiotin synthetase